MWIWILIASPFALILLAAAVGFFLPEVYTATGRLQTSLPARELWRRLHDPETYPMTGKMCRSVELLPARDGLATWIEDMGRSKLRIHNRESEEPVQLVRILEDTVVPFEGRAEFTLEDTESGCVITCRNTSTIRSGTWHVPFFRVTIALFGGTKAGCKDYLTRLAGVSGEVEWID